MLVSVIAIGNSRGIRLPKVILEQLQIEDQLDLEVEDKRLILKPINRKPRSGWEEALQRMSTDEEDVLLIPEDAGTEGFEWEW